MTSARRFFVPCTLHVVLECLYSIIIIIIIIVMYREPCLNFYCVSFINIDATYILYSDSDDCRHRRSDDDDDEGNDNNMCVTNALKISKQTKRNFQHPFRSVGVSFVLAYTPPIYIGIRICCVFMRVRSRKINAREKRKKRLK